MAQLNEVELAGLDFLIAAKKAGMVPEGFINNIINDANHLVNNVGHAAEIVTAVTQAAQIVTSIIGGALVREAPMGLSTGGGVSLEALMKARETALAAKK